MRSIGSVVLNFFVVLDPLHMFDFEDPQHHPDHGLGVQFDSNSLFWHLLSLCGKCFF